MVIVCTRTLIRVQKQNRNSVSLDHTAHISGIAEVLTRKIWISAYFDFVRNLIYPRRWHQTHFVSILSFYQMLEYAQSIRFWSETSSFVSHRTGLGQKVKCLEHYWCVCKISSQWLPLFSAAPSHFLKTLGTSSAFSPNHVACLRACFNRRLSRINETFSENKTIYISIIFQSLHEKWAEDECSECFSWSRRSYTVWWIPGCYGFDRDTPSFCLSSWWLIYDSYQLPPWYKQQIRQHCTED